ncbi:unnamed protein product, partial [Aphanomyces euteiches]
ETFDLVLLDLLSLWRACRVCMVGNSILDVYLGRVYNVLCRLRFERDGDHVWEAPVAQPPIECAASLRFHVHPTKSRFYALKVTWPATSATWNIRHSFSHFSNLRRDLTAIFHQLQLPLFQLRWILRSALAQPWPKKSWHHSRAVVAYRQDAFSNLVEHLMHVRWLCYQCHDPGHPALDDAFALVFALLDSFLETTPAVSIALQPSIQMRPNKSKSVTGPSSLTTRSLSFCLEYLNFMSAIDVIAHDEAPHGPQLCSLGHKAGSTE